MSSLVVFLTEGSATAQPPSPCVTGGSVTPSIAVTTYHYDNLRTGWNCNETMLTPDLVSDKAIRSGTFGFGLLSTTTLDDQVDAQPLFVPRQRITAGPAMGSHDVVYVATENNSIYGIDASTGNVLLWKDKTYLGTPVPQSSLPGSPGQGPCGNVSNKNYSVGINSTPVIDLANRVMYVIVYTGPVPSYYLHELDLGNLTDRATPLLVSASHKLDDGSMVYFAAASQRQRPALLFIPGSSGSGTLYAGFGSFCDYDNSGTSRGWLLGWTTHPGGAQATPLAESQLNNIQPSPGTNTGTGPPVGFSELLSSIWMSGFGVAADGNVDGNNVYFVSANSNKGWTTYDPVNNPSNSVLKVSSALTGALGHFTPSNHNALDARDMDFGSGGVTLLPDQLGLNGLNQHLAVAAGKDGIMYLNDRDNLTVPLDSHFIGSCFCGQSYFHATGTDPKGNSRSLGHIVSSGGANVMAWQVIPDSTSGYFTPYLNYETSLPVQENYGGGGFFTSISSNKEASMIVWAVPRPPASETQNSCPSCVLLYAFEATQGPDQSSIPFQVSTNLTQIFQGNAGTWPNPNTQANIVPVVANGRVFVASFGQLKIFGLIPAGVAR
jgi:hypothetical protein